MLLRSFRRASIARRGRLRLLIAVLCILAALDAFLVICSIPTTLQIPPPAARGIPTQRVYIASMHWMTAWLLRSHWNSALLQLVQHFGPGNVFVSILEGGSWDGTREALMDLDYELGQLGVERIIVYEETSHEAEVTRAPEPGEEGWVWTSRGQKERRRIPYLAGLRNRVMEPLYQMAREGKKFDKVLWLNDVIFDIDSIDTLLATRDGDWAAVCSIDFAKPPIYYDTFALRDFQGLKPVINTWPYFLAEESRSAMERGEPVPVSSCWNGITAFQAEAFYKEKPLRFRGISDSLATHHLEGSECCLIHADNELTALFGVWLNPNVRVAYNPSAWDTVNPPSGIWPGALGKAFGIWKHRWTRWIGSFTRYSEEHLVHNRLSQWTQQNENNYEPGVQCLVNEMQVLTWNGWAHL